MESKKLNFTTHEVNELIGGVPKKILWYCLGILLATLMGVGLMISITPYPKNLTVKASISKGNDIYHTSDHKQIGNIICRLQFAKNNFNEHYLNTIKNITITVPGTLKKHRLQGYVSNISRNKQFITAEAKLNNNLNLQKFLSTDDNLLKQPLMVELTNDHFTIKDKLESNFSVN